jgi:hypothetical protein
VKGLLIDGPAAGRIVEAGDPPVRRGIIVLSDDGFAADGYRYYLSSVDASSAGYTFAGTVAWPPEARSEIVRAASDRRAHVADETAPSASLNGN